MFYVWKFSSMEKFVFGLREGIGIPPEIEFLLPSVFEKVIYYLLIIFERVLFMVFCSSFFVG